MKDKIGTHKLIEQKNGIKIKILQEPSEWYKNKQKKNAEKSKKIAEENAKIDAQEKMIKNEMRKIAIERLKERGEI